MWDAGWFRGSRGLGVEVMRSLGFRVGFGMRLGSLGLGCRGVGEGSKLWGVGFGARFVYLFVSTRRRPYAS